MDDDVVDDDDDDTDSDDDDDDDDDEDEDDDDDTLETVFDENFDAMALGEAPDAPWVIEGSGQAVVTNSFPGAKTPFGRLVEISKGDSPGDYAYMTYHTGSVPAFASVLETDLLFTVEDAAGVRILSTNSLGGEMWIVYSFEFDPFTDRFRIEFNDGDSIETVACDGPGLNEWFTLRVDLDPQHLTSTTSINGVPCAEDTPFVTEAMFLAEIWYVLLANTSANTMYADNARYRQAVSAIACDDSCPFSDNDSCDDGGSGSSTSLCDYGQDCTDCEVRAWPPPAKEPTG
ncbi:MAG: hypothetical protein M5R36_12505 [Deltaproteobacteria bacterium]|nr:hypothetical protein [Deltaproteobacteria bacterium]